MALVIRPRLFVEVAEPASTPRLRIAGATLRFFSHHLAGCLAAFGRRNWKHRGRLLRQCPQCDGVWGHLDDGPQRHRTELRRAKRLRQCESRSQPLVGRHSGHFVLARDNSNRQRQFFIRAGHCRCSVDPMPPIEIGWGWLDSTGPFTSARHDGLSSHVVNDGRWHFIAMTRNATTGLEQVFVDGVLDGSATGTKGGITAAFSGLGRIENPNGVENYFAGELDDINIFSQTIAAAQIKQMYTKGPTAHSSKPPVPAAATDAWTKQENARINQLRRRQCRSACRRSVWQPGDQRYDRRPGGPERIRPLVQPSMPTCLPIRNMRRFSKPL